MGKIDMEFRPYSSQRPVCGVEQGISGKIIRRFESFALENPPQRFGYVQMRTIRRENEDE